jgi:hypothetical protein
LQVDEDEYIYKIESDSDYEYQSLILRYSLLEKLKLEIPDDILLLDTGSGSSVMKNKSLLTKIRKTSKAL